MSLAVGGRDKAGVIPVQQGPMSGGGVVVGWVRSIASCVMVTWDPLWREWLMDRQVWKHYLPATSLAGGKYTHTWLYWIKYQWNPVSHITIGSPYHTGSIQIKPLTSYLSKTSISRLGFRGYIDYLLLSKYLRHLVNCKKTKLSHLFDYFFEIWEFTT